MKPAFPTAMNQTEGLSLRDYFAAKAMQGLLGNSTIESSAPAFVSKWAYKYADAMLKAREGEQ